MNSEACSTESVGVGLSDGAFELKSLKASFSCSSALNHGKYGIFLNMGKAGEREINK